MYQVCTSVLCVCVMSAAVLDQASPSFLRFLPLGLNSQRTPLLQLSTIMVLILQRTLTLLCISHTAFAPSSSKAPPDDDKPKTSPGTTPDASSDAFHDVSDGFCVETIEDVFRGATPEFILRQKEALEKFMIIQQKCLGLGRGNLGDFINI